MTNQYQTAQLKELDALHHLHPFTDHSSLRAGGARVIVSGEGPYISTAKAIASSTAWRACGRPTSATAARSSRKPLTTRWSSCRSTIRSSRPRIRRSWRCRASSRSSRRDNINQVFYGSSGSELNDTAIRLIRHYWVLKGEPKRRIIISRKNAYHGSTIAAGSMGGMAHVHAHSYPVYEGFRHVMDPYWYGESLDGEIAGSVRPSRRARPRRGDPGGRARERRGVRRRAGAGRRRRQDRARHLLARGAAHRRQIRHPAPRR